MNESIKVAFMLAVIFPVCYAAVSDLRTFIIPNWTSIVIGLAFFAYAPFFLFWPQILIHIAIAIVVFAVCFAFWMLGWLGGGDLKLLSTISLWLGSDNALVFMLILSAAATVLYLFLVLLRKNAAPIQAMTLPEFLKRLAFEAERSRCPYGLPIAIAALIVVPQAI